MQNRLFDCGFLVLVISGRRSEIDRYTYRLLLCCACTILLLLFGGRRIFRRHIRNDVYLAYPPLPSRLPLGRYSKH